MQFLSVLPNIQSDYEMLCREEKYTRPLVNLYYYNEPLSFENQESIKEFNEFFHSKSHLLVNNYFTKYKNIISKLSKIWVNFVFLCLLDLVGYFAVSNYSDIIASIGGFVMKVGSLFVKDVAITGFFKTLSSVKVKKIVNKAIDENRNLIDSMTFGKSEEVHLVDSVSLEVEDQIILDIKKDMELVNRTKYEGYENHLRILYDIALRYLQASKKNIGGTPLTLFSSDDTILADLVRVESDIDRCVNEQSHDNTVKMILYELEALKMSDEESLVDTKDGSEDNTYPSGGNLTLKL